MQIKGTKSLSSPPREQKRETIFILSADGKVKRHRVRKKSA